MTGRWITNSTRVTELFGRFSHVRHRSVGRFSNEPLWELVDPQFTIPIDQSNVVISDTHTFNPTTINEFRFGFNRRHRTRRPATQDGNWAQQLGIPNVSPETFPEIRGAGTRYYNFGPGGEDEQLARDYTFQNNVTKIVGKHTLKFGYELVRTTYDSLVELYRPAHTTWPAASGPSRRIRATDLPTSCWERWAAPSLRKRRPSGSRVGGHIPGTCKPTGSRFGHSH